MELEKVTNDNFQIEIPITPSMLAQAQASASEQGCLNKHSLTKGERNLEGFLGEAVVLLTLPEAISDNDYDHDLLLGQIRIDVKTKRCPDKPKTYYDCTVFGYNPTQKCDMYIFVSIKKDYTMAWVNGFLVKHQFYAIAKFIPAGTVVGKNQLFYKKDNYVCSIKDLNRMNFLQSLIIKK